MVTQAEKKTYGEFGNVLLSDEEISRLEQKYPNSYMQYIDKLDGYLEAVGKKYKSHYAAIQNWIRRDKERLAPKPDPRSISRAPTYDLERIKREAHRNTKIKY